MKVLLLGLILIFPLSSFANCLLRLSIDPIFSKNILHEFEKIAKTKKYKIIPETDDRWEHFRLNIANPSTAQDTVASENVIVKLQKFVSPVFIIAYEKVQPLTQTGRDDLVLLALKDLPSCPQALYSDIFASLED